MSAGQPVTTAREEDGIAAESPRARVCLFGASGDTGNLGVSALMEAVLAGLAARLGGVDLTVFDNGLGERAGVLDGQGGSSLTYRLLGARIGRRYWRPESLWNMRVSGWLGGLGNAGVRAVDESGAVLDISGGDSFADLYGRRRFQLVALPKLIALQRRRPLVLLPQTYGPFREARSRRVARRIVRGASMAWARDPDSYAALRELLGECFDPARHRRGVDVAFLLEARRPPEEVARPLEDWLAATEGPVAGLGVSGLVHGVPDAREQFGLRADYERVVDEVARRLLSDAGTRLVLVPHVHGGEESDDRACERVAADLGSELGSGLGSGLARRVLVVPSSLGAGETKWLISKLDWFCGTRMHSTIAALSSGVPTAAIAYSGKTRGVFATCGQEAWVADARHERTGEVVDRVLRSWEGRHRVADSLRRHLVPVRAEAEAQMDAIAAACARGRSREAPGG